MSTVWASLGQGRILREARRGWIGIAQQFAIQLPHRQRLGMQAGHPVGIDLPQLVGFDDFEHPLKGPFAGRIARSRVTAPGVTPQPPPLAVMETFLLGVLAVQVIILAAISD